MSRYSNLEELPFKESRKAYITRKFGDMWDLTKFDHSWMRSDKNDYPDIKAERVIKKYMGKSFAKAFSEFCKLVKINEQNNFLDLFKGRRWEYADYIIDKQGRIQLNPNRYIPRKKKVIFYSHDYKIGYRNTRTNEIEHTDNPKEFPLDWKIKHGRIMTLGEAKEWNLEIISGFKKEFKSKKDPEYRKLMAKKKNKLRK